MSEPPASPPRLTVVGGPNGVGKSTFVATLRVAGYPVGRFLNPDDIAQTLSGTPPARELQAGRGPKSHDHYPSPRRDRPGYSK